MKVITTIEVKVDVAMIITSVTRLIIALELFFRHLT